MKNLLFLILICSTVACAQSGEKKNLDRKALDSLELESEVVEEVNLFQGPSNEGFNLLKDSLNIKIMHKLEGGQEYVKIVDYNDVQTPTMKVSLTQGRLQFVWNNIYQITRSKSGAPLLSVISSDVDGIETSRVSVKLKSNN